GRRTCRSSASTTRTSSSTARRPSRSSTSTTRAGRATTTRRCARTRASASYQVLQPLEVAPDAVAEQLLPRLRLLGCSRLAVPALHVDHHQRQLRRPAEIREQERVEAHLLARVAVAAALFRKDLEHNE